jgi:hypothetical protein
MFGKLLMAEQAPPEITANRLHSRFGQNGDFKNKMRRDHSGRDGSLTLVDS